jgi:hypothetical protein
VDQPWLRRGGFFWGADPAQQRRLLSIVPPELCYEGLSSFVPPGFVNLLPFVSHGLRHGLHSIAATRLQYDLLNNVESEKRNQQQIHIQLLISEIARKTL